MYEENKKSVIPLGKISFAVIVLVLITICLATFGINDNGYRTVVQWPNGKTFVRFDAGLYFDWFGKSTEYPDVLTYEFDDKSAEVDAGVSVRYQDGGTGSIYGVARFTLPITEEEMLIVHRSFRTEQGVRDKLITPVIKESLNLTAGLMTSEEAYAEKRNEYLEWSADQIGSGKYLTNLEPRTQVVEPAELGVNGEVIRAEVTRVQNIPVIRVDANGQPMRGVSPFIEYSVLVSGFQLVDWTFEQRTLAQINEKREANMAIITSQANSARANQERLQAIAEGERNVATAEYAQEVLKAEAVVVAQRESEVAAINAARQVEVNRQNYLAQVQDVLAAGQEAEAIELRSSAEAEAREKLINADGALAQKLATYERVNATYAQEFGKQKWIPELIMGGGDGSGDTNSASDMINLLSVRTAQQLQLDMSMSTGN